MMALERPGSCSDDGISGGEADPIELHGDWVAEVPLPVHPVPLSLCSVSGHPPNNYPTQRCCCSPSPMPTDAKAFA